MKHHVVKKMFRNMLYAEAKAVLKANGYPHISPKNNKIGHTLNVNLPAIVTCDPSVPCAKGGCYACSGFYQMENVKKCLKENLMAYVRNPDLYFAVIDLFITNREMSRRVKYKPRFFRWHSSGDIPDYRYLEGVIEIARLHPNVKFLCFTKRSYWVNQWLRENGKENFPKNLTMPISYWRNYKPANDFDLPVAYVQFPNEDNGVPVTAFHCPGNCEKCGMHCWEMGFSESVAFDAHSGAEKKKGRKKSRKRNRKVA